MIELTSQSLGLIQARALLILVGLREIVVIPGIDVFGFALGFVFAFAACARLFLFLVVQGNSGAHRVVHIDGLLYTSRLLGVLVLPHVFVDDLYEALLIQLVVA